jgi:hypothetical protein
MTRALVLVLFIGVFVHSLNGQMIDSVLYQPYPNVDSIEYWHLIENKDTSKLQITKGFFINCSCPKSNTNQRTTEKNRLKVITSEGVQLSYNKWVWTYYNDVRKSCCSEFLLSPDSTVTYLKDHRIKKIDKTAEYKFLPPDSMYVIPFLKEDELKYEVQCDRSKCTVVINDKYILKTFPIKDLGMELILLSQNVYTPEAKHIIQKSTKR